MRQSVAGGDRGHLGHQFGRHWRRRSHQLAGVQRDRAEFSPDGTKILYISTDPTKSIGTNALGQKYGYDFSNDIWVMNADGSSPKQLTETNPQVHNFAPTWSPDSTDDRLFDGRMPASAAGENGSCGEPTANGLHVMNADGTAKTLLLNEGNQIRSGQLSWSPDGSRIAFDSWVAGGIISTVEATGGVPTLLVANAGAHYPSWAPTPLPSGKGTPDPEEGTPAPSPGDSAGTPAVLTPEPVLPSEKAAEMRQGQEEEGRQGQGQVRQEAQVQEAALRLVEASRVDSPNVEPEASTRQRPSTDLLAAIGGSTGIRCPCCAEGSRIRSLQPFCILGPNRLSRHRLDLPHFFFSTMAEPGLVPAPGRGPSPAARPSAGGPR